MVTLNLNAVTCTHDVICWSIEPSFFSYKNISKKVSSKETYVYFCYNNYYSSDNSYFFFGVSHYLKLKVISLLPGFSFYWLKLFKPNAHINLSPYPSLSGNHHTLVFHSAMYSHYQICKAFHPLFSTYDKWVVPSNLSFLSLI